jgi:hypothetical protein
MAPYSMDLRTRVLRDSDAGLPSKKVAAKYAVSRAWLDRVKQRKRETGELTPRKQTKFRRRRLSEEQEQRLVFGRIRGGRGCMTTRRAVSGRRTRSSPRCVSMDSPHPRSSMARSTRRRSARTWSRSWYRRCGRATWSCWTTSPCTSSPKSATRLKRPARGCASCRPTVLTFNPIEQLLAKLKAFLRAARPRTFDQVCDLIRAAIALFTADECANYVRHSGYRVATA